MQEHLSHHLIKMARILGLLSLVFCYSSTCTLAQDSCGRIGHTDETELEAIPVRDHMFYLDLDNPANCSGTITSWRVCYHGPAMSYLNTLTPGQISNYRAIATYSVYRRTDNNTFSRLTAMSRRFRAIRSNDTSDNQREDGPLYDGFNCYNISVNRNRPFTIEAGDIIGACVFDPEGNNRHQLDIVSNVSGHTLYEAEPTIGSGCDRRNTSEVIQLSELSRINSRKLHIYANIGK